MLAKNRCGEGRRRKHRGSVDGMVIGCPMSAFPTYYLGSIESFHSGLRAERRSETNFVHFVAARMTLIAIIRIVSPVVHAQTQTAKHGHQKCDPWRRSIAVRTPISTGEFYLSRARLLAE